MKNWVLATLPSYDKTTHYISAYAKHVLKSAKSKNFKVTELERPRLTKRNVSKLISKNGPGLVFLNGHGNEKAILGDKIDDVEEILIEEGKNEDLLSNEITYARTCFAAASLGKACVKKGSGCFIGYSLPFSFWSDKRYYSRPLSDKTAKLFLEPSNAVISSLIKGSTAQQAADKFVEMSKKNILKILKSKESYELNLLPELWSNIEGQQVFGNKDIALI